MYYSEFRDVAIQTGYFLISFPTSTFSCVIMWVTYIDRPSSFSFFTSLFGCAEFYFLCVLIWLEAPHKSDIFISLFLDFIVVYMYIVCVDSSILYITALSIHAYSLPYFHRLILPSIAVLPFGIQNATTYTIFFYYISLGFSLVLRRRAICCKYGLLMPK